jgi:hypothetical protein
MKPVIKMDILRGIEGVDHFFSTRLGGFSTGEFQSLNLDTRSGDNRGNVDRNFKVLEKDLKLNRKRLFYCRQIHGRILLDIGAGEDVEKIRNTKADALCTAEKNTVVCVKTADCCPILIACEEPKAVAAVHAGWKGTLCEVLPFAIEHLRISRGIKPETLRMAIGPSIGYDSYEVGEEVIGAFSKKFREVSDYTDTRGGRFYLDLKGLNRLLALNSGILEENIELSSYCTYKDEELFFSYRRQGGNSGRHISGIVIR